MSEKSSLRKDFIFGLWRNVPPFRLMLGLCASLAVTSMAINGLAMALAVAFVLIGSNVVVSAIRRIVPDEVRIPVFVVVIATFVTVADLFLRGWFPPLSRVMGPYVPLITVNCIILGRAEAFAYKNSVPNSLMDALGHSLGYLWAMVLIGSIRELIGHGSIFGFKVLGTWFEPWVIMILPPGAFLTLGTVLGFFNLVSKKRQ